MERRGPIRWGLGIWLVTTSVVNAYTTAVVTQTLELWTVLGLLVASTLCQLVLIALLRRTPWFRTLLVVVTAATVLWNTINLGFYLRYSENLWLDKIWGNVSEGVISTLIYRWNAVEYLHYAINLLPLLVVLFVRQREDRRKTLPWLAVASLVALEVAHVGLGASVLVPGSLPTHDSSARVLSYGSLGAAVLGKSLNLPDALTRRPTTALSGVGRAVHRNVVLLQVESLDSNVIGKVVGGVEVTPFLNRLIRSGAGTPRMIVNNSYGTIQAELTILNSVIAKELPANDAYAGSVAKVFRQAGYDTLAFHGDSGNFYHRNTVYPRLGFNAFYDMAAMGLKERIWGADDGEVLDWAAKRLKAEAGPWLASVITMSSHNPFNLIDPALLHDGQFRTGLIGSYFRSLHYVDAEIERFCTTILSQSPHTVILIYGDHPAYLDTKVYTSRTWTLQGKVISTVPFAVTGDVEPGFAVASNQHSQMDIGITALEQSGIPYLYQTFGLPVDQASPSRSIIYLQSTLSF